jgi:hypothetical protein
LRKCLWRTGFYVPRDSEKVPSGGHSFRQNFVDRPQLSMAVLEITEVAY